MIENTPENERSPSGKSPLKPGEAVEMLRVLGKMSVGGKGPLQQSVTPSTESSEMYAPRAAVGKLLEED